MGAKARATWYGDTEAEQWRRIAAQNLLEGQEYLRTAFLTDPVTSLSIKLLLNMVACTVEAMEREGVDYDTRTRVMNTAILGHPDGIEAHQRAMKTLDQAILSPLPSRQT